MSQRMGQNMSKDVLSKLGHWKVAGPCITYVCVFWNHHFVFVNFTHRNMIFGILEPTICRVKTSGPQFSTPTFSRGPIYCHPIFQGTNMPNKIFQGLNLLGKRQGPNLPRTLEVGENASLKTIVNPNKCSK